MFLQVDTQDEGRMEQCEITFFWEEAIALHVEQQKHGSPGEVVMEFLVHRIHHHDG